MLLQLRNIYITSNKAGYYAVFLKSSDVDYPTLQEDDPVILKYWIIEADRYKDALMSRYQNETLINDMFMEAFNGFNYGRYPAVTLEAFNNYYKKWRSKP